MAIRRVMLTERQLANLVKRIVREAEDEMEMDMDMGDDISNINGFRRQPDMDIEDNEEMDMDMSEDDAIEAIAQFFEDEGIVDLPERKIERIEDKIDQIESKSMMERYLREDEEMRNERPSFAARMMKKGGGAMTALGLMGFVGNVMGWSEFAPTQKLHELTEMLNAGNYTGPISVAMIASGIALALAGRAKEYNEKRR